jgi:hypothetical protein
VPAGLDRVAVIPGYTLRHLTAGFSNCAVYRVVRPGQRCRLYVCEGHWTLAKVLL